MLNIVVSGVNGKMGQTLVESSKEFTNCQIVAGVDRDITEQNGFEVYQNFFDIRKKIDIMIDFSNPFNLTSILNYCIEINLPVVICTTGFTSFQYEELHIASRIIPIFLSSNMSLGINLLIDLVKKAATVLYSNFDIEIVEKHHNRKLDAPSGTALTIAKEINDSIESELKYVYGRETKTERRNKEEIGIHSIRGGSVVGEHSVLFLGKDEILEVTHKANSRNIFAIGALKAAIFLKDAPPGFYGMKNLIENSYEEMN